jgi:DNA end-binding protein Ku
MAIRSIASLSLTFGLVSIPVKVYLATESSVAIKFRLMAAGGARLRQQYVADAPAVRFDLGIPDEPERDAAPQLESIPPERDAVVSAFPPSSARSFSAAAESEPRDEPRVIERAEMVKGYEFEPGKFVLFTADELKSLEAESRHTIDIVSFIPERSVDPIYFDKAYFLAPDRRGAKPYSLLRRAMQETGRCALAKWAWRSKEYVVQIRPAEGGMVLQQLLYADEVRSIDALGIELAAVGDTELRLATQLIGQIELASYDPRAFVDEEKQRILEAVKRKIAGRQIVSHAPAQPTTGAQVLDLVAALRASLKTPAGGDRVKRRGVAADVTDLPAPKERKPARRAPASAGAKSSKVRKG